eukprot:TRINITY_DN15778_c0_g1_i2.p1 TRINITY_DN15778_c0_g1~~TRINITY_DN15778_c0_g1_i2.p1  ORF type:complete len:406 (-),score=61.70 TRINITY_DN15778_c0_g1_i2:121-1338(-)
MFMHVVVMARLTLSTLLYPSGQDMLFDRPNVLLGRLLGAFVLGKYHLTIVLNCVSVAVSCYAWSVLVQSPGSNVAHLCQDWNCMQWFFVQEVVTAACICILAASFEKRQLAEAEATVKATLSRNVAKAFSKLLSFVYDVVLNMDADLRVIDDASSLGTLLLHAPNRCYRGAQLQDYLYSESDKIRFAEHMGNPPDPDGGVADPVCLQMRDSSGGSVSVELLHTKVDDPVRGTYVIGIRELDSAGQTDTPDMLSHPAAKSDRARKKHRPTKRAGTPAQATPECLRYDDESTESDSGSSFQHSLASRMLPNFKVTDDVGIQLSLMRVMMKWNVNVTQQFCCSHHFLVHIAQKHLELVRRYRCYDSKKAMEAECAWQCSQCGIIDNPVSDDEGKTCCWCATDFPYIRL